MPGNSGARLAVLVGKRGKGNVNRLVAGFCCRKKVGQSGVLSDPRFVSLRQTVDLSQVAGVNNLG